MHDLGDLPCSQGLVVPVLRDRPPASAVARSVWLPRHRKSPSLAREFLRQFLVDRPDYELYFSHGQLMLSELVSNAVQHARTSPGRLIFVRFELSSEALRIEVHDASAERPTMRRAGGEDESGRGLWLVDQLSVRWGCCPRAGGVGKALWSVIGPAPGGAASRRERSPQTERMYAEHRLSPVRIADLLNTA